MKPPFIKNPKRLTAMEVRSFVERDKKINEDEVAFCIKVLAWVDENQIAYASVLAEEENKTKAAIRKRLEKLTERGVFKKTGIQVEGIKRPVSEYYFYCVNESLNMPDVVKEKGAVVEEFRDEMLLKHIDDMRIDDLILTCLFSALPFNTPRVSQPPIEKSIRFFGIICDVIVLSVSGKACMGMGDLRYVIVLLSRVFEKVQQQVHYGEEISNDFLIDVTQLNADMEKGGTGTHIESTIKAVERIASTIFELPHVPLIMQDRNTFDVKETIQIVSNLSIIKERRTRRHLKYYLRFQIPSYMIKKMKLSPINFYQINPRIVGEKDPLMLALHLYLKRRMAHKIQTLHEKGESLHKNIGVEWKYEKFVDEIEKSLDIFDKLNNGEGWQKIRDEDDPNSKETTIIVINLYGFVIKWEQESQTMIISKDAADPIVGAKSKRKQKIMRETQGELFSGQKK